MLISTPEDLFKALNEEREAQNIAIIDERLDELAEMLGRQLTDEEQSAILDIVDEHTPTGKDGMYLYPLLPFDYAWQIYQLKQLKN